MAKFSGWGEDSRAQLAEKVKQSTATHKIVNTHYSPYNHYVESGMTKWFDTLRSLGVLVWINDHTCNGSPLTCFMPVQVKFTDYGKLGALRLYVHCTRRGMLALLIKHLIEKKK